MAYRRKHGTAARAPASEDFRSAVAAEDYSPAAPPSSLAAQAIRASSSHRDSSLSSAYGESAIASARRDSNRQRPSPSPLDSAAYEYTSMKGLNENESKYGFWGVLTRKAKAILEDDSATHQFETHGRNQPQMVYKSKDGQFQQSSRSPESHQKTETPSFQRSSDAKPPLLNYLGGTIKNALEEGLTMVENKTADIIQETRKLNIRRKESGANVQNQAIDKSSQRNLPQIHADLETQLKASRDVANAMAAKAKLLLRELKTVKADLAFAKERCAQLEEENKILRESCEKGNSLEDDDLIRLQLETLLAEKGRLAHENSVYARENRFLREIVEYHQLTMQDLVYVNEGIEEVTEVSPIHIPPSNSSSHNAAASQPPFSIVPTPLAPDPASTPASPIIVPEACPIVPTPPSPSQAFTEPASRTTRGPVRSLSSSK